MQAGVVHMVFSSLEDPNLHDMSESAPETQPGRKLAVFEVKAEISVTPRLSISHAS